MKSIKDYLVFEAFVKGKFKKGMNVIMCQCSSHDEKRNDNVTTYTYTIESVKPTTIEKVVSKDNGRYSGDQHTWIYCDSIRFECNEYSDVKGYDADFDLDYAANKSFKDKHKYTLIFTKDSLKRVLDNNGKISKDYDRRSVIRVYDFSKIDKEELNEVLK